MTHRLTQALDCDRPKCDQSFRMFPGERLNDARARAAAAGWSVDRTTTKNRTIVRDFCPAHKEK